MTPTQLRQEPDRYALVPASTTAAALVMTFEAVDVGQPYADAEQPAARHVAALADAAAAVLFPAFVSATADVLAAFAFHEASFERSQYGLRAAALHAACRELQPTLAAFLRSDVVFGRVRAAALTTAPSADLAARADQAVADYRRALAGQLIGVAGFEPAASVLAVCVPALQARLAACRQRHVELVAAATARGATCLTARHVDAAAHLDQGPRRTTLSQATTSHHGGDHVEVQV